MGMDIGAYTPFTHALREREYINDLLEELCGARLTFSYMRIGGVAYDLHRRAGVPRPARSSTASSRCSRSTTTSSPSTRSTSSA